MIFPFAREGKLGKHTGEGFDCSCRCGIVIHVWKCAVEHEIVANNYVDTISAFQLLVIAIATHN